MHAVKRVDPNHLLSVARLSPDTCSSMLCKLYTAELHVEASPYSGSAVQEQKIGWVTPPPVASLLQVF